ncbi:MAG: VTC domain-containing protein [Myxococcales bacterium]|nr:VTC domain-containing protein [Myxococcales bacterium]
MPVGRDAALTAAREEHKYLLRGRHVPALIRALEGELQEHHHDADSPLLSPMTQHFTTTVYFDTHSRKLFRAALHSPEHIKLRAREYYDLMPLAEVAVDEREMLRSQPILWLELKRRRGDHSDKRRLGVPKRRLAAFLSAPAVDPELQEIQRRTYGPQGDQVIEDVLTFLASFDEQLGPSCIVNYRRRAFQNDEGTVRVTVDHDLATFAPQAALLADAAPLTRTRLGPPAQLRRDAVIEVKHLGQGPTWLTELIGELGSKRTNFSKFVMASAALGGTPDGQHSEESAR